MKKTLIVLAVLFITGLGCKKIIDTGGGLCACSPVQENYLSLVLKNNASKDILDPTTTDHLAKDKIQLYSKSATGEIKQISFGIRPPFSYGDDKFEFYQLISAEILWLATSVDNNFYLKLGDSKEYLLNIKITNNKIEKLLIDKLELPLEKPTATAYSYVNSIYSFKMP